MDECNEKQNLSVNVKEAVKQGESVMFTLEVTKAGADVVSLITREFEDFDWLHHTLINGNNINGVIVPPQPIKSFSDPKSAENLSKKQLGDQTTIMKGDHFDIDCKLINIYLDHMLKHPVFGNDPKLISFLDLKEAPTRARLNKGLITRLSSAFDSAMKGFVKDLDEYFKQHREYSLEFNKICKELYVNFNKLLVSQWRLSSAYRNTAIEFTSCDAERDSELIKFNKILRLLSEGMEDEAASWELRSTQEELDFGCYIDIMAKYSEALKEMHVRRVTVMHDYTSSEKALEKAKPAKKASVEEIFEAAKMQYEKVTKECKEEIQSFKKMRLEFSKKTLLSHAETQMKISQDFYAHLFHTRKAILEMQI